jgi:uncharacterized protein YuzB (UPF0349 family)
MSLSSDTRPMTETIEYCLRNVDDETRERLAADAGASPDTDAASADIVEQRCLQRCGTCYSEAFLVVDGAVQTARSHATLLTDSGLTQQGGDRS